MNTRYLIASMIFLLFSSPLIAADMQAWLDRNHISEMDTVQLTLEVKGQVSGRPDTRILEKDFEVLGVSTGSSISIINGRTDSKTTWQIGLNPKRSGAITIPPLKVDQYSSNAIQLNVSSAPVASIENRADIAIENDISADVPYVQSQLIYTTRLYNTMPIKGNLSHPKSDQAIVKPLGKERRYEVIRNGKGYEVTERRYAIFPQHPGELIIHPAVLDGQIEDRSAKQQSRRDPFRDFFGNNSPFSVDPFDRKKAPTRRVRVKGKAITVNVLTRPDNITADKWLPAKSVELSGQWLPQEGEIRQSEPITLNLELQAEGITAHQLPELTPPQIPGVSIFPDQPQRKTEVSGNGVVANLTQTISFIPQQGGDLIIPGIKLDWWNTAKDQPEVARMDDLKIKVIASATSANTANELVKKLFEPSTSPATSDNSNATPSPSATPIAQTATQNSFGWMVLSALLALAWLVTLKLWWNSKHNGQDKAKVIQPEQVQKKPSEYKRAFVKACKQAQASAVRSALIEWAAVTWPSAPPVGLEQLADLLNDEEATKLLSELDSYLYKGDGEWQPNALQSCIPPLIKHSSENRRTSSALPELYPSS